MTAVEENCSVVERFDALLETQELDQLDQLCTPDMVNHSLAPGRPAGLAGTLEFLRSRQGWRPDHWDRLTVIASGNHVVQHGIRSGYWPGGEFRGFDIPAGDYEREVAFVYRLAGGRIAERWAVRDDLAMLLQLGAKPS